MRSDASDPTTDPLSHPDEAGAYVGSRPEREGESIPGGIQPSDQRIAAYGSRPGVDREPDNIDADPARTPED